MRCEWCESENIQLVSETVYWELPDGTRTIEIKETPTHICKACQIHYQSDQLVKEIEDQLLLIDTKKLSKSVTFEELMNLPRLLKKNYFDFYS